MSFPSRNITATMRRYIFWVNAGGYLSAAGVAWGLALIVFIAGLAGFEIRGSYGLGSFVDISFAVIFAAVVTVFVSIIVAPLILLALRLAKHGVRVNGTIRQKLGVTWRSTETVRISYTFSDKTYTIKSPLGEHTDAVGAPVQLIVDPHSPERAMLHEKVFPPGFDVDA